MRPPEKFMSMEEFELLRGLIRQKLGLVLKGDKRLSLHLKLQHRLRLLGLSSWKDYYHYIHQEPSGQELLHLAAHITNQETFFFRERPQLELFRSVLQELWRKRQPQRRLRILSAGCSSGEELYTLSILAFESGLFSWGWQVELWGADVSAQALQAARKAQYGARSLRGLNGSEEMLKRYFHVQGGRYVLKRIYTRGVNFKQVNLVAPQARTAFSDIDVLFCRNVLIYMDDEAIQKVVGNLHAWLKDDGYLFLGASESLIKRTELFEPLYLNGAVLYRKRT